MTPFLIIVGFYIVYIVSNIYEIKHAQKIDDDDINF